MSQSQALSANFQAKIFFDIFFKIRWFIICLFSGKFDHFPKPWSVRSAPTMSYHQFPVSATARETQLMNARQISAQNRTFILVIFHKYISSYFWMHRKWVIDLLIYATHETFLRFSCWTVDTDYLFGLILEQNRTSNFQNCIFGFAKPRKNAMLSP